MEVAAGSDPDVSTVGDETVEDTTASAPEAVPGPPVVDAAGPQTDPADAVTGTDDAGTGSGTLVQAETADEVTAAEADPDPDADPGAPTDAAPGAPTDPDSDPEDPDAEDATEGPTTRPLPITQRRSLPGRVRRLPATVGGWTSHHKALATGVGALLIGLSGVALLVVLVSPTEPLPPDSALTGTLTQVGLGEPTPSAVPTDVEPVVDPWAETTATTTTTTSSRREPDESSGSDDRGSRSGSTSGSSRSIGDGLQDLGSSSRRIYTWDLRALDPNGNEVYMEIPMDGIAPGTEIQETEITVGPEGSGSSWSESYEWSYSSGS
jgi:hypothetical protein